MTPRRSGFTTVLRAEWTKFRTVRGWVLGMAAAPVLIVLFAGLAGISSTPPDGPPVPTDMDGQPVVDSYYFVHRPLTGDGSVTVSVSALDTQVPSTPDELVPGAVPWAKAGLIIKDGTREGSRYAAIMLTGGHGVRMQHDYVADTAGPHAGSESQWLRLTRSGDTITGYASADGTTWTEVDSVTLDGLGTDAQAGLFVASPPQPDGLGSRGSVSTAGFTGLSTDGDWADDDWAGRQTGPESPGFAGYPAHTTGSFTRTADGFTVTGAGDIAPAIRDSLPTAGTVNDLLTGGFAALIAVIVVGALFITTEYRDNLIQVTLSAGPARARVLAAKSIVLGTVGFAGGLAGTAIAIPLGRWLAETHGVYVFPMTGSAQLRVVLGTGALLAAASILALAIGAVTRRGAGAVTTGIVSIVVPFLLFSIPFMPPDVSAWLTRVTPAAAFAVQQTMVRYPQVDGGYTPHSGYFPLPPWAGFAVLAGCALAGLLIASALIRRRDA